MMDLPRRPLDTIALEMGNLSADEIRQMVGKENPVILEIGANIGQTTIEFIKAMPKARIFCFEPDPRAAAILRETISLIQADIKVFEFAVGDFNGTVNFHQS